MCGIVGFVGPGGQTALSGMMARLAHRGPDGEGVYEEAEREVLLGHTRLAVIDLDCGAQPMFDDTGEIGVIFNGEIYNHGPLRQELEAKGHRFLTHHSDTEVLVHGYREWGTGLFEHLNGMFALCLFDRRAGHLVLARDRMGEKPLYYIQSSGIFAFASEVHALFAHPKISRRLDTKGVQKFFAYGYSPGPTTVFDGVHKLQPGEILTFDLASGNSQLQRFFTFRIEPDDELVHRPDEELAAELRSLLDEAVALRLQADVPLGLFLSGGIDSSAILDSACLQRPPDSIDAFTIGFQEASFDESAYARMAADHSGCRHHLREATVDSAKSLMGPVYAHLGEPFGDPSILPTSMLAAFARTKVTVALSGDGGDELFAGYDPFLALCPGRIYQACVPNTLHRMARRLAGMLPVSHRNMSLDFKVRRTLMGLSYHEAIRLPVWMSAIEPDDMASFFVTPLPAEELYSEAIEVWNDNVTGNDIDRALEFFTRLYLPDDILFKSDRASMMHSLEARAVFLDNGMVDFARRLPHRFKFRRGKRKWLLKKALAGRLPQELIDRRKKGFGIPIAAWLREMAAPANTVDTPLNDGAVLERFGRHRAGQSDERHLVWAWLGLQKAMASVPGQNDN